MIYLQKAEYIVYVLIVYCEEKEDSSVFSSLTSEFIYSCWWISSLIRKTTMAPLNNIYDANICVGEVPGDRYEGTACSRMETGIFQPSPPKKKN